MTKNNSNGFFEKLMDESLQRLVKAIEKEVSGGIGGVKSSGTDGGIMNVIIHNNAPVNVSAQETTGANGQKQMEIMIDQMVANALVRGRHTTGVLGSLFNILPGLSGR